ncbi:MAG: hypothetical protein U0Q18_17095 [Bryobacteraceae bacterium]
MEAALCFGFLKSDWETLKKGLENNDEDAWLKVIGVFERRMRERFFSTIDALFAADTKPDVSPSAAGRAEHCIPGFAIMALCCLLIDTLQGFREKPPHMVPSTGPCEYPNGPCIKPPPGTAEQFKSFLRRPAFRDTFQDDALAQAFVNGIRNGIIHEAETRKWVIWRDEPLGRIVEKEQDGFALNRTLFYTAVIEEFESYLEELRNPSNNALRNRFKKKMNDVARET